MNYLARVRKICLALPETTEKKAWGAPTFRVKGGKMFAMFVNNHHQDGRIALWCPAPPGAQKTLVKLDPDRIFVPPYVGTSGWIGLHLDRLSAAEVAGYVREAYCLIAPKKLLEMLGDKEV